jgi:chromosome segregation ATPase
MKKTDFRYENDFRKKEKCLFNDSGFCKFGDKCRSVHHKSICSRKYCDKSCNSRHPKPCRFRENCKFLAEDMCAFKHSSNENDDKDLDDLKRQVEQLKQENEKKQLKLTEVETDLENVKANQEAKEVKAIIKELKLVVTELIKDVEAKDEKLVKMEEETHQLKLEVESMKSEYRQATNCEKCDFVAKTKKDLRNHIESNHKENGNSDSKEGRLIMNELKLVVTALIKDVKAKEEKLSEMDKETQNLKLQVNSIKAKDRQHKNHECGKCNCEVTSKTTSSDHSLSNHKEKDNSELSTFRFGNSK